MIKFLDLSLKQSTKNKINKNISSIVNSNIFINGKFNNLFEQKFSDFVSSKYCIGVGNGLDALSIILKAHNIGPGDEVIVPSHTFIATWFSVSNVGAEPVSVDVDVNTYNIDSLKVESKITKKTKAIIAVHLYGNPANLTDLKKISRKNKLYLFDDAAQCHGAKVNNKRIGALTDATAWSFYPGKNLGAFGDAGAITTNSSLIAKKCRKISNYGSEKKYIHDLIGLNSRLDNLQAAVLLEKLSYLDKWNEIRKKQAMFYLENIKNDLLTLPNIDFFKDSVWHLFIVKVKKRDFFINYMRDNEIECLIHYPKLPANQQPFKKMSRGKFDSSFQLICDQLVSLPIGPNLKKSEQVKIVKVINKFL